MTTERKFRQIWNVWLQFIGWVAFWNFLPPLSPCWRKRKKNRSNNISIFKIPKRSLARTIEKIIQKNFNKFRTQFVEVPVVIWKSLFASTHPHPPNKHMYRMTPKWRWTLQLRPKVTHICNINITACFRTKIGNSKFINIHNIRSLVKTIGKLFRTTLKTFDAVYRMSSVLNFFFTPFGPHVNKTEKKIV